VRPLADLAGRERDPNVRDRYCDALARIGDPAAIPALKGAAGAGDWDQREGPLVAISRLGGAGDLAFVGAAQAKDCPKGCDPARQAAFAGMIARLEAARACGDVACWAGKLGDASAAVRDRAALEVGRAGTAAHAAALGDAVARPVADPADLAARYHAVLGLGWIAGRERIGPPGAAIAGKLEATIAADRGRTITAGVNEDALQVAMRLRRASE
jgi:hypothetical protein